MRRYIAGLILVAACVGCGGGGNEVTMPENPTSPPPPGSLSNADDVAGSTETLSPE